MRRSEPLSSIAEAKKRALKVGDNGGLIPRTVADMIIKRIRDISPLYERATKFNVRGELSIPTYDESTTSVTAAYVDELTELTEKTGELKVISLKPYIVGALSTISNKLINNNDFDIVGFVVNDIAEKLAQFAEKEGLTGSTKISGLFPNISKEVTAADDTLIADDIIKAPVIGACRGTAKRRMDYAPLQHSSRLKRLKPKTGIIFLFPTW